MQTDSPSKTTKSIEVGKFYLIHDSSKSGHPGLVVWKNEEKNRYLVIRFDSDKFDAEFTKEQRKIRHITKLKHPIDVNVMNSYVRNRPTLCKRKDIGVKMDKLIVHEEDYSTIDKVKSKKAELGPSLRK